MNASQSFLAAGCVFILVGATIPAQQKRPIQPADCVTTRFISDDYYHGAIQMNLQGTRVAYLVRSPNLATNRNDIDLYTQDIDMAPATRKPILVGWPISQLQWRRDGIHIDALVTDETGRSTLMEANAATGANRVLWSNGDNVKEYAMSQDGKTIVFATERPDDDISLLKPTPDDDARGYRIPMEQSLDNQFAQRKLFVTKLAPDGEWTAPIALSVKSPFSGNEMLALPYVLSLHLSISPDGAKLLLSYVESRIPDSWKASPFLQPQVDPPGLMAPVVLMNLSTGEVKVPLDTPMLYNIPVWSDDGKSFVAVAESPVNSRWETKDIESQFARRNAVHLFWTNVESREVEEVAPRVANTAEQPLLWKKNGALLVHTSGNTLTWFSRQAVEWKAAATVTLPGNMFYRFAELASDGVHVIGDYEDPATPPELFQYTVGQQAVSIIDKLNPEFDNLTLAPANPIQWKTSTGYEVTGTLLLPPGYVKGKKYPLVIQTKPDDGWFVCDSGANHDPSFAPQPIANADMLYLIRSYPEQWSERDEISHYPTGYPGQIGEAAFQTDIWDSAVDTLDKMEMIDRDRIGMIGFSRSGWYTEFSLVHGRTHYRAATAADNVKYSFGEYWMSHSLASMHSYGLMYGGPPYGPSLKNWLAYSTSFNLDKIHTPLLLEVMGFGTPYNDSIRPPVSLATDFEIASGLTWLKNPTELYYYPNEVHQPEHPQARLASLQRNVDWYRFWLKNYERPNPEDPDQYVRWRKLRFIENREPLTGKFDDTLDPLRATQPTK